MIPDYFSYISQLCSFQGPAGGANRTVVSVLTGDAGAAGLSKLNSTCRATHECAGVSSEAGRHSRHADPGAVQRHRLEAGRVDGRQSVVAPVKELPRKEVIQPQLPLRLPCYDFTPITSPTFDGCLP